MKVILITGTSSGFGQAIAQYLHQKGHKVYGTSRNPASQSTIYTTLLLDVTSTESIQKGIQNIIDAEGKIDVLINNAGIGIAGSIEDTALAEAKAQFETNFWGAVNMTQATLPIMRAQNSGLIINISSIAGHMGLAFHGFYAASKFAMEGYTEALRLELLQSGIGITTVSPGDFKTSFTENRTFVQKISDYYKERLKKTIDMYINHEINGLAPILLAKLVDKIISKGGKPKPKYYIGKFIQVYAIYAKRILGERIFEKIMIFTYKL